MPRARRDPTKYSFLRVPRRFRVGVGQALSPAGRIIRSLPGESAWRKRLPHPGFIEPALRVRPGLAHVAVTGSNGAFAVAQPIRPKTVVELSGARVWRARTWANTGAHAATAARAGFQAGGRAPCGHGR